MHLNFAMITCPQGEPLPRGHPENRRPQKVDESSASRSPASSRPSHAVRATRSRTPEHSILVKAKIVFHAQCNSRMPSNRVRPIAVSHDPQVLVSLHSAEFTQRDDRFLSEPVSRLVQCNPPLKHPKDAACSLRRRDIPKISTRSSMFRPLTSLSMRSQRTSPSPGAASEAARFASLSTRRQFPAAAESRIQTATADTTAGYSRAMSCARAGAINH